MWKWFGREIISSGAWVYKKIKEQFKQRNGDSFSSNHCCCFKSVRTRKFYVIGFVLFKHLIWTYLRLLYPFSLCSILLLSFHLLFIPAYLTPTKIAISTHKEMWWHFKNGNEQAKKSKKKKCLIGKNNDDEYTFKANVMERRKCMGVGIWNVKEITLKEEIKADNTIFNFSENNSYKKCGRSIAAKRETENETKSKAKKKGAKRAEWRSMPPKMVFGYIANGID